MTTLRIPLSALVRVKRFESGLWVWRCRLCGQRADFGALEEAATAASVDHLITVHASAKYSDTES